MTIGSEDTPPGPAAPAGTGAGEGAQEGRGDAVPAAVPGDGSALGRRTRLGLLAAGAVLAPVALAGLAVRQPVRGALPFRDGPRADSTRLREHVEFLVGDGVPRNPDHPRRMEAVAEYILGALASAGGRVEVQPYTAGGTDQRNVIARFGSGPGPVVVVGAHYDVFGDLPGADDNASGVAGLLELARLLGERGPGGPVELVAYSTEEPPYFGTGEMGSAVHAAALEARRARVRCMICLEMIGYYTDVPVAHNPLMGAAAYPRHGRFVAVAGRWRDRALARHVKRAFRGATDLQVCSYSGPVSVGADLSDQRNYWRHGWEAVMVTDTGHLRNPNYHRETDTPDTLDYDAMAGVVDGVLNAVLHLGPRR